MPPDLTGVPAPVRHELEHLYSLLRLAKKLERAHDYHAVIEALSEEVEQVLGYHTTWAYLTSDDPDVWYLLSAHEAVGITDNIPTLNVKGDPFLEEIVAASEPVVVEDARTDPRTNKEIVAMLGNRTILNVPMKFADKQVGTIGTGSFGDEGVHLPTPAQLEYLSSMASHAAVAFDRIRLYQGQLQAEEEQRKAQEQIAHVQRLESLGVLAGSIAHDFNNILTAILGNAALAESKLDTASPVMKHLHNISAASRRATDLCLQMLSYAGHRAIQQRAIDLSELVHEMGSLLEVSIGKDIGLIYHLDESLPATAGDVAQIQQIIMNLITNANEAIGDEEGSITITTGAMHVDRHYLDQLTIAQFADVGDHVFFEVSDSGCGMDAPTLEHLFDPFFTTKFTGRGLGMSAVLGIIQGHHGALNIYTEPDHGTTFKVLFPATDRLAEPLQTGHTHDAEALTGTVLVVDDEEMVRDITVAMLEEMGFHVLAAENGRNALAVLRQHGGEIGVALVDITMPDMDGVETFRQMRCIRDDLPMVLASGYSQQDVARRFTDQQPEGFIQKPFTPENLRNSILGAMRQAIDGRSRQA